MKNSYICLKDIIYATMKRLYFLLLISIVLIVGCEPIYTPSDSANEDKENVEEPTDNNTSGDDENIPETDAPDDDKPDDTPKELANFAEITTNGSYTFISNSSNEVGKGETVEIPKRYYICKYAVTNSDYKAFISATNRNAPKYWINNNPPEGREQHPVLWISYDDAESYCKWMSDNYQGWTFRLPTQAEWEYAAVGEARTAYPWGEKAGSIYSNGVLSSKFNYNAVIAAKVLANPDQMATYNNAKSSRYGEKDKISDILTISSSGGVSGWVDHTNYLGFIYTDIFTEINETGGYTCSVDAYHEGKSWCGCYNMSGNCWEWTSTIEIAQNGAEKGQSVNVIRGGSWYANSSSCKGSFRGEGRKASSAYNTVGFRLIAEPR